MSLYIGSAAVLLLTWALAVYPTHQDFGHFTWLIRIVGGCVGLFGLAVAHFYAAEALMFTLAIQAAIIGGAFSFYAEPKNTN
jgi:hypothetical protein